MNHTTTNRDVKPSEYHAVGLEFINPTARTNKFSLCAYEVINYHLFCYSENSKSSVPVVVKLYGSRGSDMLGNDAIGIKASMMMMMMIYL